MLKRDNGAETIPNGKYSPWPKPAATNAQQV